MLPLPFFEPFVDILQRDEKVVPLEIYQKIELSRKQVFKFYDSQQNEGKLFNLFSFG